MSLFIIENTLNSLGHLAKDFLDNYNLSQHIGNIGCFGDISFISNRQMGVLTPTTVSIEISNKIDTFENLGAAPYSEFRHRNLRKVSMQFKAIKELTNIQAAIRKFTEKAENGEHYPLIIGGIPLAKHNFCIKNFKPLIKEADWLGRPEIVEFNMDFEEYIPIIQRTKASLGTLTKVVTNNKFLSNIEGTNLIEKEYINEEALAEEQRINAEKEYIRKTTNV